MHLDSVRRVRIVLSNLSVLRRCGFSLNQLTSRLLISYRSISLRVSQLTLIVSNGCPTTNFVHLHITKYLAMIGMGMEGTPCSPRTDPSCKADKGRMCFRLHRFALALVPRGSYVRLDDPHTSLG